MKYIGIIRYPDGSAADNTTKGTLQKVWQRCCRYTSAYVDGCDIYEAKFDDDGNIIGDLVESFYSIAYCREEYERRFGKAYNAGQ